ncbi:MAG: phosphatase 2C-like domain-containing protein [Monoraphidium minutum]|nr:MAG: phosphatase 2C-like domain-containing protein [Monoraphidium minutum]
MLPAISRRPPARGAARSSARPRARFGRRAALPVVAFLGAPALEEPPPAAAAKAPRPAPAADPAVPPIWLPAPASAPAAPRRAAPQSGGHFRRAAPGVLMAAASSQGGKPGVHAPRGAVLASQHVASLGVFDGHQGPLTAAYAAQHMPELLHSALAGHMHASLSQPAHSCPAGMSEAAVESSFLAFDRWWRDARCDPALTETGWDESGATALVSLVAGDMLTVGNAGDGVALLARGGRAMLLSQEHRASNNASEIDRVIAAGGRVFRRTPDGPVRVSAPSGIARYRGSMVTRSLGDYAFKHPAAVISPEPALASVVLTPADSLLLVATDGVTDVLQYDDAVAIALLALQQALDQTGDGGKAARAAAAAVATAALERGSCDNVTAAVMVFDWTACDG